jgi:DNA-binding NtrC family response regulator
MTTRKDLLCIAPSDLDIRLLLGETVRDWEFGTVSTLAQAERELRHDRYLVGLLMHDREVQPLAELDAFLRRHSHMVWIAVCSKSNLQHAPYREMVVDHLYDYHTAPLDPVRLAYTVGHARGWAMLRSRSGPERTKSGAGALSLIGNCDAIARLRGQIDRIAKVTAPVLVWGESGSGKELVAQALHAQSDRAAGPFVPVNCGAIAPSLIHSELFGHERGAFTGATRGKPGLIEAADGGTLFLDEIGDLPLDMQANLLRFLQEKTVCRLGSTRSLKVDVRVVAASHVHLQQAVAAGAFREDLYYRLAVLPVTVPPLRERGDDVIVLAEHFFRRYASERSPQLKGFSSHAIAAMLGHDWPGNVRELINRVRRASIMADGRLITPEDLDLDRRTEAGVQGTLGDSSANAERSSLRGCLERHGQNVSGAARELGISRTTMYRLLDKHGMRA